MPRPAKGIDRLQVSNISDRSIELAKGKAQAKGVTVSIETQKCSTRTISTGSA